MKHEIFFGDEKTNHVMGEWAAHQIWGESGRGFDRFQTMGVLIDGKPAAVMVFHNYHPEDGVIEISGAAVDKRWLNSTALHEMFAYPFDQLDVQLVVMRTSTTDKALARMLKSYGFNSYRIPRLRGRNKDEIIQTLTVEDWRNNKFERRHGKERPGLSRSA